MAHFRLKPAKVAGLGAGPLYCLAGEILPL